MPIVIENLWLLLELLGLLLGCEILIFIIFSPFISYIDGKLKEKNIEKLLKKYSGFLKNNEKEEENNEVNEEE